MHTIHKIGNKDGPSTHDVKTIYEADNIEDYLECLEMFLTVNSIEEAKKVAYLLSGLGMKTYAVLKNLAAPSTPSQCTLVRIKELLIM